MLDYEIADIYGYDMYTFNELIKNNINQFPDNYRFQLTQEEFNSILKSQNVIPNCNENRELPYVFTMQGVCILTTFFHGLVALERNTIILRIFADEIKKRVEEQRKEIKALHKELSKFKEKNRK